MHSYLSARLRADKKRGIRGTVFRVYSGFRIWPTCDVFVFGPRVSEVTIRVLYVLPSREGFVFIHIFLIKNDHFTRPKENYRNLQETLLQKVLDRSSLTKFNKNVRLFATVW